jgi:hypothetical protein
MRKEKYGEMVMGLRFDDDDEEMVGEEMRRSQSEA